MYGKLLINIYLLIKARICVRYIMTCSTTYPTILIIHRKTTKFKILVFNRNIFFKYRVFCEPMVTSVSEKYYPLKNASRKNTLRKKAGQKRVIGLHQNRPAHASKLNRFRLGYQHMLLTLPACAGKLTRNLLNLLSYAGWL